MARPSRSTRSSVPTANAASDRPSASTSVDPPVGVSESPDNELRRQVCAIFRDAQRTTASHRKLFVKLRKLHERCCHNADEAENDIYNGDAFNYEFARCVLRIMPVKKTEPVGEKMIRFISLFLKHGHDQDKKLLAGEGRGEEDVDMMGQAASTTLTNHVMETALPLLTSKDKFVRYRSIQLITRVIHSVEDFDTQISEKLRHGLVRRIRDKEAMVRVQAVLGLGCYVGDQADGATDAESGDDDTKSGLLDKLFVVMQNDPSPDVRRSVLQSLTPDTRTLPHLLKRARDQDPATRRALYSHLLTHLSDFRHLSLTRRENLLRSGLRDRDENVRKVAQRLFRERWIQDCAGESEHPDFDGLLELLERIDVISSGVEGGIGLDAMRAFWEGRPDYREAVVLDDNFWKHLSAESVFMARSYNDFCRNEGGGKYETLIEDKLPEVVKIALYLERYIVALIRALKRDAKREDPTNDVEDNEEEEEEEEDAVEQEFIVEQLLHIARTLDYSDEVGRRKMFAFLRQTLSIPELPDGVTKLTIDALRDVCAPDAAGEREFCSVVVEAVSDVHDTVIDDPPTEEPEESFHSARSDVSGDSTPVRNGKSRGSPDLDEDEARAKAIKEIVVNMKCLHMVQCMLANVNGNLQENGDLVGMLNNLVVPAVRSHKAPVRERGLACLGLCSLLDKSLAEENLALFILMFGKGHTALQISTLNILTDILSVHGSDLVQSNPNLLKAYTKALKPSPKGPEVQATATVAVSKLLLGRVFSDPDVSRELLKSLVVMYFDPASAENQLVKQALNYFLPVFCYSRAENQDLLRSVALDALHALFNIREGLQDADADVEEDMTSLTTIGACLVDWTDPRKCYSPEIGPESEKRSVNGDVHLQFAQDILERLEGSASREEKKVVAGLLGKLHVSPGSSVDKIREVYALICTAVEDQLVSDTTSRNALYKIHVSLGKLVNAMDTQDSTGRRLSRSTSVGSTTIEEDRLTPRQPGRPFGAEVDIKEEDEEGDSVGNRTVTTEMQDSVVGDGRSDGEL